MEHNAGVSTKNSVGKLCPVEVEYKDQNLQHKRQAYKVNLLPSAYVRIFEGQTLGKYYFEMCTKLTSPAQTDNFS